MNGHRILLAGALAAIITGAVGPAHGDDWHHYRNARFGYQVDIPSGFSPIREAANGDGGISEPSDRSAEFRVWGSYLTIGDFEVEIEWRIEQDISDGWNVTYRKQHSAWASWSGVQGDRIFYSRAIPACDGASALFRVEYGISDQAAFDPVIRRLVKSLRTDNC